MTYLELKALIQSYLENDDTELTTDVLGGGTLTAIDNIIDRAELRISIDADFLDGRATTTATVNSGESNFEAPTAAITIRSIRPTAGGIALIPKDEEFIDEYVDNTTAAAVLRYWSWQTDGTNIKVGPTASASIQLDIGYVGRPTGLSTTTTTTWLSTTYPSLLQAAAFVETALYMKEAQEEVARYEKDYMEALEMSGLEQKVKRKTDHARAGDTPRPVV